MDLKLMVILEGMKQKYQKGSASPKLGYLTLDTLQSRGDQSARFSFVKNPRYPGIYIFDKVINGIAYFHSNDGTQYTDKSSKKIYFM